MHLRLVPALIFTLLALVAPVCFGQAPPEAERPIARVYVLSGQSNMVGVGMTNQLSPMWTELIPSVHIFRNNGFEAYQPTGKRFGPELGFAKVISLNMPDQTVHVVKFALGGQPLHAGWDRKGWQGPEPGPNRATFYPGNSLDDPNIGNHYLTLHQKVQAAFQALREAGHEPQLAGILWMQGEADAKNKISAKTYAKSLAHFKLRLEDDFKSKPVPFVFGQVLPHEPALGRFTHRTEIREAMVNADMRSGHPDAIPGCIMVPTEGMPLNNDTVHYNTQGQLLLGQALGLGMLQASEMIAASQATSDNP